MFDIAIPGQYSANVFTDAAIDKIKNRGEDPFFMYLSYMNVHSPYQVRGIVAILIRNYN